MDEKQKLAVRPPIVTVLGHVDHGKTSLLDAIRKTRVTAQEAGGITQGIGASVVKTPSGKKITFIDTPGHAAFSKMRSRGAKVADMVVLVVDASDGVKPQTQEAISLIKADYVPVIVAITKIDLPAADPEMVLSQLEKEGFLFEGRGGDIPFLKISAKTGEGLNDLLETISLLWEISEDKSIKSGDLEAVVIETFKEKGGLLVSVVLRSGKLTVGGTVFAEDNSAKIKGLFDFSGKPVKEILAGFPGQILGFSHPPVVGTIVQSTPGNKAEVIVKNKDPFKKIGKDEFPVILKAENAGALEALTAALPPKIVVVSAGVGDVSESDVLLAKSTNAIIFAFEARIPGSVQKLAEAEKVKAEKYAIIYELLDRLNEIVKKGAVEVIGKAEIIAQFPFNDQKVAGCRVTAGKITKTGNFTLSRGEKELGKVKVISLKKGKQEVTEVKPGEECGILFTPQLDFTIGDVLVSAADGK